MDFDPQTDVCRSCGTSRLSLEGGSKQLFVVDKKDKRSGAVSAVYVFNNHEAALQCRTSLGLGVDHLRGCGIFSEWRNGEPFR